MFTNKKSGGLGLTRPHVAYYSEHLSFALSILNNDDPCVRDTARCSLNLHMQKRGVPESEPGENTFAGYAVDLQGNKLKKTSKVNWPKSQWVHVFEMCKREGLTLRKRADGDYYFEAMVDDDITISIYSHEGFKKFYINKCKENILQEWKDKQSQGRIVREVTDMDSKSSMHVFRNHNLHDKTR